MPTALQIPKQKQSQVAFRPRLTLRAWNFDRPARAESVRRKANSGKADPLHAPAAGSETAARTHPVEDVVVSDTKVSPRRPNEAVTVLLVEDERALREIVKRQLTRHGYQVLVASDGVEALALAVGQEVDLVVTDVLMPNMKGNELAAELAAVCPTAKVIFMSGYAPFTLDASDTALLLHKPFSEDDLLAHIHMALDTGGSPDSGQVGTET